MDIKPFNELVKYISLLPGIGEKSAIKIAIYILQNKQFSIDNLINILLSFKNDIKICSECGFLTYKSDKCEICNDEKRDNKKILVVANIEDVIIFENSKIYNGLYHVLGGLISPNLGITPDDLSIDKLLNRLESRKPEEIIIGLPKTSYGEITSYFISDIINKNKKNIKITTLSEGISSEFDINQISISTLISSFKNRKTL